MTAPKTALAMARVPNDIAAKVISVAAMRKRTVKEHTPHTVRRKVNEMEMIMAMEVNRMRDTRPRKILIPMAATYQGGEAITRIGAISSQTCGNNEVHPGLRHRQKDAPISLSAAKVNGQGVDETARQTT